MSCAPSALRKETYTINNYYRLDLNSRQGTYVNLFRCGLGRRVPVNDLGKDIRKNSVTWRGDSRYSPCDRDF